VLWQEIGKPERLATFEKYLTLETNFDTMLVEKMLPLKLSAAHFVRITAGKAQGFTPIRPPRVCCHIRPRTG